jgi:transposase
VKDIDPKDLVFIDEMGVLLGLIKTHACAVPGERAYDFKPFYRGSKVSVIGAISVSKVLAAMTLDDSMDAAAFKVYVSKCLVSQLWEGAVVVMDNLPAHKVEAIVPLSEAVGAKVLYLGKMKPAAKNQPIHSVQTKHWIKPIHPGRAKHSAPNYWNNPKYPGRMLRPYPTHICCPINLKAPNRTRSQPSFKISNPFPHAASTRFRPIQVAPFGNGTTTNRSFKITPPWKTFRTIFAKIL